MKTNIWKLKVLGICAAASFAGFAPNAFSAVLTFEVFTDAPKTVPFNGNLSVVSSYGDAVTDFNPAGSFGGNYYTYGSTGGFTPAIDLSYNYVRYNTTFAEGPAGAIYTPAYYGDLSPAVWSNGVPANGPGTPPGTPPWNQFYMEFRFTPTSGSIPVSILSFDFAGAGIQTGLSLKIVQNIATSPVELWSAGADGTISTPATGHTTYTPNIAGAAGSTVSLLWGVAAEGAANNVNVGLSNIAFSQVPEPSSTALGVLGIFALLARIRRFRRK